MEKLKPKVLRIAYYALIVSMSISFIYDGFQSISYDELFYGSKNYLAGADLSVWSWVVGISKILFGVFLLPPRTRRFGAIGAGLLLLPGVTYSLIEFLVSLNGSGLPYYQDNSSLRLLVLVIIAFDGIRHSVLKMNNE